MSTHVQTMPPVGTVTMLFTDVEGSTRLARQLQDAWPATLADHHRIVRNAIESAGGYVVGTEGDSFFATFGQPSAAATAATTAQRALRAHAWPSEVGELRVRMGLHTGEVEHNERGYTGLEVHRAARVGTAAHGGQVILTKATHQALDRETPCEDLGLHRLKDFPEPVRLLHLVVDADRTSSAFPSPRTLDVRPTNLPPIGRSLIGREPELAAMRSAFLRDGARIVTLTGSGGIGKTSAALAAATSLLDDHPKGVWLVAAESLNSASQLIPALAAALHVPDFPGTDLFEIVAEFLDGPPALLVFDNLEHLTGADALIRDVLQRLPAVRVLATSRAPLRLVSERVIALTSLPPSEASTLMMERARAGGASIDLEDPSTNEAITALCEKLDGLPLAIELAAARMRLLSPSQVLERLGSVLELGSAEADRPERQRSLRATSDWTLGLLPSDSQQLFARLAVFAGPAPLEFIEEICGSGLDVVEAALGLVDFSLLQRTESGLVLAAALHELAAERLADSDDETAMHRAHAKSMATLGERVRITPNTTHRWLLTVEHLDADTWSATAWARNADVVLHRLLVIRFCGWWAFTGRLRGAQDELDFAIDQPDVPGVDRGQLLLARGHMMSLAGRAADAAPLVDEALPLVSERPPAVRGDHLVLASIIYGAAGRFDEATATGSEAVNCYRIEGSVDQMVRALIYLAQAMTKAGDIAGAGRALDEAEALTPQVHTIVSEFVQASRADWALATGDPARALTDYAAALAQIPFPGMELWSMASMVEALSQLGEWAAALELGAAVEEAAAELGVGVTILTEVGEGMRAAMDRARRGLPADRAVAVETAGRSVAPGDRITRALTLARDVMSAPTT